MISSVELILLEYQSRSYWFQKYEERTFSTSTVKHRSPKSPCTSILEGFLNSSRSSHEKPGLTSKLTVLWAESWGRDPPVSLPKWNILWTYSIIIYYLKDTSNDWTQMWLKWTSECFSNQHAWPYWPCPCWSYKFRAFLDSPAVRKKK